ncbi:hypothetical protein [uncultured Aquimarina sp.]|uniref:hypothetical protein n=1 Tax=uncultured Aquimarina sp. TaxID=575652 RepID=UPI0026212AC0|nr:hypothetical protein [uncultured Aquimarina sp.]
MINKLSNLGKALTREQQKTINGGLLLPCHNNRDCVDLTASYNYQCVAVPSSPFGRLCILR